MRYLGLLYSITAFPIAYKKMTYTLKSRTDLKLEITWTNGAVCFQPIDWTYTFLGAELPYITVKNMIALYLDSLIEIPPNSEKIVTLPTDKSVLLFARDTEASLLETYPTHITPLMNQMY